MAQHGSLGCAKDPSSSTGRTEGAPDRDPKGPPPELWSFFFFFQFISVFFLSTSEGGKFVMSVNYKVSAFLKDNENGT